MVVQVLTIQCVRDCTKVLAMYVPYLVQWSSEAENFDSQDHWLVEQSGEGKEHSGYSGSRSDGCHYSGLSHGLPRTLDKCELRSVILMM